MNITHINAFDLKGGAARAAYRIHKALLKYKEDFDVTSRLRVIYKSGNDNSVEGGPPKGTPKIWTNIVPYLNRFSRIGYKTNNPITHSTSWILSGLGKELHNRYKNNTQEIINLYWLGDLTISIQEIANIRQPLVWTLFDQWAFSGAEHYENIYSLNQDKKQKRYIKGYFRDNRPKKEKGFDINRMVWETKKRCLKNPFNIVCCSEWLAKCAKESSLMRNWPVDIIPIPIDLDKFVPINKSQARKFLNLPLEVPLILFGAIGGTRDPRKGSDLLFEALQILKLNEIDNKTLSAIEVVVFGGSKKNVKNNIYPTHYMGHLNDDANLSFLYSAVDLLILPSRLEALGQTGIEAHACGTPVVGFNHAGLVDVVDDKKTGSLANPFDTYSLAKEIKWALENKNRNIELGKNARKRAEDLWSEKKIAKQYCDLYRKIIYEI